MYKPYLEQTYTFRIGGLLSPQRLKQEWQWHTEMMLYYHKKDDVHDFDKYNPTSYGGGYNIHMMYGRLLLSSDETCYHHH